MSEFIRVANDFGEYSSRNKQCKYCNFKGHRMKYCPLGLNSSRENDAYLYWFQFCNQFHRKESELTDMRALQRQLRRELRRMRKEYVFISDKNKKKECVWI